ncbi:fructosamine kinase family protein [Christiangramia forsetii]|uniref:Fructosamine kinase family protein n=2 Tax=Christiangramia forsetii TaxID=411153 RepID=A0LY19_CHRFK|nr:fructosamine kinase family protein [Christiangramia forsetii]GGG35218.1 aminoglycoside phosphotransferase [Christiangramia forsetii]CAL65264.1 fructosamine kinase family protein [Christiangramia forsetii KT0803]
MSVSNLKNILQKITTDFGKELSGFSNLTGGDINEVFLIESGSEKFVVKINDSESFPGMFEAEKLGLEKLLAPSVIDVPKPLKTGYVDSYSYLLLEHKSAATKSSDFLEIFGEQLARLHQQTSESFGLEKDNYIGSLPQYNSYKDSAAEFYIEMRLKTQIKMADEKGFQLNVKNSFYKNCMNLIPSEPPALIHGDLWNGNYLVNSVGKPCLIDPAVAYAPREMDLGMMKLFGGFDKTLFHTYNEVFPLQENWEERIPLWQLYYLLVHLNIFGSGYKSQVASIIKKFS